MFSDMKNDEFMKNYELRRTRTWKEVSCKIFICELL